MHIFINGEAKMVKPGSVETLLQGLGLDRCKVAIELNRTIVPRSLLAQTPISEGDRIEIVQFIGGG